MNSCFALAGVECGWLKLLFYTDETSFMIWASDIFGHDAAKAFIHAVSSLLSGKTDNEELYFNAENKAHILTVIRMDKEFIITIRELITDKYSYDLLHNLDKIKRGNILFESRGDMGFLAQNLFIEFSKYKNDDFLDLYEKNWFPFPHQELNDLNNLIKKAKV
jgi:hypothetical protein